MKGGANTVVIEMSGRTEQVPRLIYSTLRLHDIAVKNTTVQFRMQGYCQNVMILSNTAKDVRILDTQNRKVRAFQKRVGRHLFVEFQGKGSYTTEVSL